ncbi:hypothetical protein QQX98_003667 [Neonectria punicea]|uniref:Uncharacterized protein n=1 Tax=Neonectria punicea TaxID=979145 RepID=A0ABR1HCZ9_9HYPO
MDAQNAAQSDQTRPTGASPQRSGPRRETTSSPAPVSPKPASPAKESRPAAKPSIALDADAPEDRDSDAETIVLPGKDGHSPSKIRKVRQEDKSDGDADAARPLPKASDSLDAEKPPVPRGLADVVKRKRLVGHLDRERQPRSKDASSGLSSAPASPPQHQHQHKQRRRSDGPRSSSDSEQTHPRLPKTTLRDKLKSGERLLPHKRKIPKMDSDDEADGRKVRRQRTTSSAGIESGRLHRESKPVSSKSHHVSRSISPQPRSHRRSVSQLSSYTSNGLGQKKKRLPTPLQPTDYHSDDSSASASPHPRSSKLRGLATPAAGDPNASPIKLAPHKKHLDAHGQTFLARACARGEYEGAKHRLGERPEDLNVADYAGNTPLQIAAINGCENIVKLLIEAGCNLDCVNYDKDTPLLDAVDNGHLGVVKLLLEAGVNPRKANVNGEEPIDRVSDDTENAAEIRAALLEAKKRAGERRRTSEDHHSHHDSHDARDSHAPDSPRQSPATGFGGRRSGTVRSTKTRNDLLYMPLDDKTLRQAAGRGDEETVARILQVKEGYDDPESMVAAARGGHDLVIQLLLGLGGARPDPAPVSSIQPEFATPILAAIGQENIKVLELLLEQQGFDPTRRMEGETYYEIARRRQGTNWKEEEHMLKNAYDEYKRSHKDSVKTKSPTRRDRERDREEREAKRTRRAEAKEDARQRKRNLSSPSRDTEPRKKASLPKLTSPKEKRKSDSLAHHGDEHVQKRGPGRPKKEDRISSITVSDREISPTVSHKQLKTKRIESDAAGVSSEGETIKPRRKLVSKGELRGEREKQRRASMVSNASTLKDHPLSPHDMRHDEPSEKHRSDKLSEKYHDRTKALKRDESRDRLAVAGDGSTKRHRASITPDRPSNGDKDDSEVPMKRRRLDGEGKEKRQKRSLSSDERPRKSNAHHEQPTKLLSKSVQKNHDDDRRGGRLDLHRGDSVRSSGSEKQTRVKSEDVDLDMQDADPPKSAAETDVHVVREKESEQEKQRLLKQDQDLVVKRAIISAKNRQKEKEEEERKRVEAEEKKKRDLEESRRKAEEEDNKRKEEIQRKDELKRKEEIKLKEETKRREEIKQKGEEKKRREEEEREAERKRKEEEERIRREEEERQRREAEEKARLEEEEKRRVEEEKKKKEEEEQRQREEEERLRREQLEREAAEEARRQREEEERKERERRERAHKEELEKKRAAREAELRRQREEQERARLDKLPPLLRWLDTCANPKLPSIAERFKRMQGVRYDTIRPEANQTAEGREQWVLNTHVALLLGEKDLDLSRYTAWERVPVSALAKKSLWRVEWQLYSLVSEKLWELGLQLPNYYGDEDPRALRFQTKERLKMEAWDRFFNTDMFFVKVSDLMYTVPNIPHLRHIQLGVEYRELLETEAQGLGWRTTQKWKSDPDASRYHGFAPRYKYYTNGSMKNESLDGVSCKSTRMIQSMLECAWSKASNTL